MASEKMFKGLVDRLPYPVMGVDSEGRIFYGNDELTRILGTLPAWLTGERVEHFLPGTASWIESGESFQPGLMVGGSAWAVVQRTVSKGRFFILIPEQDDISDFLSEESRDGKWDLGTVLGSLYDDILITDQWGRILQISGNFELMYGKGQEEMVGKTVYQLERIGVFKPSITKRVLQNQTKQTGVQQTREGRRVLVTGVPVCDRNGKFTRVICYSRDITEPIRLKEHLGLIEQELVRIKSELETLRQEKLDTGGMVAVSERMKYTFETAARAAQVDVNSFAGRVGCGKNRHSPLHSQTRAES